MKTLRIIDLNIVTYVQQSILANPLGAIDVPGFYNFVNKIADQQLAFNELSSINQEGVTKKTKKRRRVWKSTFNSFIYWQDNKIIVKKAGSEIPKTKYKINYAGGEIQFAKIYSETVKPTDQITASFLAPSIHVANGFPNNIEDFNPPFITSERLTKQNEAFELGSRAENVLSYRLDIFARNKGELSDIEEIVFEKLDNTRAGILDYSLELPLKEYGVKNPKFDPTKIMTNESIEFFDVISSTVRIKNPLKIQENWVQVFFTARTRFHKS